LQKFILAGVNFALIWDKVLVEPRMIDKQSAKTSRFFRSVAYLKITCIKTKGGEK